MTARTLDSIATALDQGSRMDWFTHLVAGDLAGTRIAEIIADHATKTEKFPVTADRIYQGALPPEGSPARLFSIVGSLANASPAWDKLRDALATRMLEIDTLAGQGADFRIAPPPPSSGPQHPLRRGEKPGKETVVEDPDAARADRLAREAEKSRAGTRTVDLALQPLLAILPPPPPAQSPRSAYLAWLNGRPWHPTALGLKIPAGAIDMDDMMDLERDITSNIEQVVNRPGVRAAMDMSGTQDMIDRLEAMPGRVGGTDVPSDRAAMALCTAAGQILEAYAPDHAEAMKRLGAVFVAGPVAARLAAQALSVERAWLQGNPEQPGHDPDLRGFPAETAEIKTAYVLKRSMFLHLVTSMPVPDAFMESLLEIRAHQAFAAFGFDDAISLTHCEKLVYDHPEEDLSVYRRPEPDRETAPAL